MVQKPRRTWQHVRRYLLLSSLIMAAGISVITSTAYSQAYTCFPTCDTTDGRFLSIAGAGINTLSGQDITMTVVSPANASTVQIGIFDGETGGKFDIGTVPLEYTLYADPNGDGTGSVQVGQWLGTSMPDFAWYNVTVNNTSSALTPSGNYYYVLRIRTTDFSVTHWSNFKLRTNGVIYLRPGQAFSISAPLPNLPSAQVIYPNYPTLTPTTYDGNWTFYINVPTSLNEFFVWDGDFDYGDYQCLNVDEDDVDTPGGIPSWAPAGTSVVTEGVAHSAIICANGDTATANPTDDSPTPALRRSPNIYMELIDPNGISYVDGNPSGNLEWEQFRISTEPFDRDMMDYHADTLPAGIYTLNIYGMDLQNLDAMRFGPGPAQITPYLMGVDSTGTPVQAPPPVAPDTASITGTLYFDGNNDGVLNNNELGIPGIPLFLYVDVDNNNTVDHTYNTTTDANGTYTFGALGNGHCTVVVDSTAINVNAVPTGDYDGVATRHRAVLNIDAQHQAVTANFGYRQVLSAAIVGRDTVMASMTTTYTSQVSESGVTYTWSITGAASIDGSTHNPTVDVLTGPFGTFTLKLTITKNGSSYTTTKNVLVAGVDFVLFAYYKLEYDGRCGTDTTRGIIDGNVGVNYPVTGCNVRPNLIMGNCTYGGFVGDGTRVMGDYVDLASRMSVWDLYANRSTGSTSSATKRHGGPSPFTAPVIAPTNLPKIPSFDYNGTNICVNTNQTRSLAPGRYGTITINNGGTLNLSNGIYNIKSIRAACNVTINTMAGTKVRIARDLLIGTNGYVGPQNGALFIVRSDGICSGGNTVDFGSSTEFHGQVLAPNGMIDLGSSNDLVGRFWGKWISGGCNTNLTYWGPVANLNNQNNDGFQKKLLGNAIAGAAANTMLKQGYPNPFSSSTTVTLSLQEDATVTARVVDAAGHEVRTLLDAVTVSKGDTKISWDGRGYLGEDVPSGTYFIYVQNGNRTEAQPVVLAR